MLDSLQYLRAIASIMVVCFHVHVQLERMDYHGWWPASLASGVDLFFIISGFLMLVTTTNRTGYTLTFYQKRLVRIVPLYWIITSLFVFLMLFVPSAVQSGRPELWHIIASYLFLPAQHPVFPTIEPVVIPGWTLNYEMFFYLVWGLVLLLPDRMRVATIIALFAALVLLGAALPSRNVMLTFYTSTIIIEFIFGVMVGIWYLQGRALPVAAGWALVGVGFAVMLGINEVALQTRFLLWGIPAAMIVVGALALEKAGAVRKYPFFVMLGDASYSIYIVHGIALSAAGQIWRKVVPADLPGGIAVFTVGAIIAAVAAGVVVHFTIERPLLRLMSRRPPVPVAAGLP